MRLDDVVNRSAPLPETEIAKQKPVLQNVGMKF